MNFDDKKVDHLFILVGSNALPCALAGLLLAKENGNISLITSEGSYDVAQRLQTWLEEKFDQKIKIQLKSIKESSPQSIFNGVSEELDRVKADFIGLNYTGGTKIMSVHSYRAIEQWVAQHSTIKPIKTSFSYLNPRKLEMVFDPKDPSSGELEKTEFIGQNVELKFNDFLNLHGWILEDPLNIQPVHLESTVCIVNLIKQNDEWKKWVNWLDNDFRKQIKESSGEWKDEKELKKRDLQKNVISSLSGFVQELTTNSKSHLQEFLLNPIENFKGFKEFKHLFKWLDGDWLEHYLLGELQKISFETNLCDFGQDIETKQMKFQLDGIAVCGYQLFAFSCCTDKSKPRLKQKLFEVFMRARQLGGDEARVALVCCSEKPQEIEREVRQDVDTEGRIKVFGLQDLPDLANKLKMWIKEQSHQNQ
ncbi:MAG: hypothetical protein WAQ98_19790 [Blastocatellia bacterium]